MVKSGACVVVGGALLQVLKSLVSGTFMSIGNKKVCTLVAKPNRKDLEFVMELVASGKVKPVIDRHYQLHEIAEAVRCLSGGYARGKAIITVFK